MQSDLLKLVSDTLNYIQEEKILSFPNQKFLQTQKNSPKNTLSSPSEKTNVKISSVQKPHKEFPAEKKLPETDKNSKDILEKIQKHLPHIKLIQNVPSMPQAAIVVFYKQDLPFLKNLAKAIQKHHCPVKILDGEKIDSTKNKISFELILTQKKLSIKNEILLESIASYQNDPEQKKLLWTTICKHLSPKSF